MPFLLALSACHHEDEATCPGVTLDGICYVHESDGTTDTGTATPLSLLTAGWRECDVTTGDGSLDLDGCVFGVCGEQTYADALAVSPGPPDSFDSTTDPGYVFAHWPQHFGVWYPDVDLDGQPDDGALSTWIEVYSNAVVSTDDGLGPGVSMSCFVGSLGDADRVDVERRDDWEIVSLEWDDKGLEVWDYFNRKDEEKSDGRADVLYLSYY